MQPKLSTLERLRELAKINTRIFARPKLGNTYVEHPEKFHLDNLKKMFRDIQVRENDKHGWNDTNS